MSKPARRSNEHARASTLMRTLAEGGVANLLGALDMAVAEHCVLRAKHGSC